MKITKEELERILRKNPALAKLNEEVDFSIKSTRKVTKLECDQEKSLAQATPDDEWGDPRYLVCIKSVRKHLLDRDNVCEKMHVDCLRYAKVIPGDAPDQTDIKTPQRKPKKGEEEYFVIEVYEAD